MTEDILAALPLRRGHFLLESGYHSDQWLTLDALFVDPAAIAPLVTALADRLRPHAPDAVCGPLLGGAFLAQALAMILGVRFYYTEPVAAFRGDDAVFAADYQLSPASRRRVRGETVAVVDDVISAGSSVRATVAALTDAGATTGVVAAFMVLGDVAWQYFAEQKIPMETLRRATFDLWKPEECPLCRSGLPLVDPR
jgi:orotate phosphoribosyltransferase